MKESYGWAVRLGGATSSFPSRERALLHANSCAARLRGNGEEADVIIDTELQRNFPIVP